MEDMTEHHKPKDCCIRNSSAMQFPSIFHFVDAILRFFVQSLLSKRYCDVTNKTTEHWSKFDGRWPFQLSQQFLDQGKQRDRRGKHAYIQGPSAIDLVFHWSLKVVYAMTRWVQFCCMVARLGSYVLKMLVTYRFLIIGVCLVSVPLDDVKEWATRLGIWY